MKKLLYALTTTATLLIVWACTDLDHSNPFDPDWNDVTGLNNLELQIEKIDRIKVIWDSDYFRCLSSRNWPYNHNRATASVDEQSRITGRAIFRIPC